MCKKHYSLAIEVQCQFGRVLLGLILALIPVSLERCFAAVERPHILFIAVDDLRPELGCYGNEQIQSPHIDSLAEQSVRFNRAYCQQAVCNPSRASLLTGLRPDTCKVWDLITHFRDTVPDVVTLPQHFRRHGYNAVAYGKIFHNNLPDAASWDEPNHWPVAARVWSEESKSQLEAYRDTMRADGKSEAAIERMRAPAIEVEDVPDSGRPDGEIADQAIAALQQLAAADNPFFLAVGFINPHLPFNPPKKYWDLYDADELLLAPNQELPEDSPAAAMNTMYELRDYMDFADTPRPNAGALDAAQQVRLKHGYYSSVSFIDAQVGRLLSELDRIGLSEETIVVLWGDHGWKLGEHGSWCKQTNYEIDTRAPLMIRVPGSSQTGEESNAVVEFVDVFPTLCELAGLPLPEQLEGKSLVPLLHDPKLDWTDTAFSQFPRRVRGGELMGYAMRTDRYRYVEWLNRATCETVAVELYDHQTDPGENRNVAGENTNEDLVDSLSGRMWEAIERPSPGDLAKPPLTRPIVRFQNNEAAAVEIFWLAPDGRRISQGLVQPGKQLRIKTTRFHRFEIGVEREEPIVRVLEHDQTIAIGTIDPEQPPADERPNILILMGDDWSWPHAGFLHDPAAKTPTFDRLARGGVVFEHAFVSSPSCTPSRFAVASGQWHWRLGEGANLGGSLAKDVPVYADLLRDAGYRTGYARKGAAPSEHTYRGNDPFGERFKSFNEFMNEQGTDQPFCFWYGAGEPHRPYRSGTGIDRGYQPSEVKVPACLPDTETVRSDLCDYYAAVEHFDSDAARMLRQLDEAGELEDTLIVVAGDNGMPFPRCKATLYDTGTRVPLLVSWPKSIGRACRVNDFVSLTDLAPTLLEVAEVEIPETITGRSLLPILKAGKSGQVDPQRTFVLSGMEQHVYSHPARAIRNEEFLYVRNFAPQEWRTGETLRRSPKIDFTDGSWPSFPGAFSFNIDPSPTKSQLIGDRYAPELKPFFELACGQRPVEELYDLATDPDQLRNVADKAEYKEQLHAIREQLASELRGTQDPRFPVSTNEPANEPDNASNRRPNILFIAMDDLNDWIGCMGGHPQTITPNLDRLAASGVLFTNAHCPAPACNPSRTAIFTGRSPHVTGLYDNRQKMRQILPTAEIIPKTFSRHGYHSSGSGKMLHYFIDAPSWDDYFPNAEKENPFPRTLYPDKRPVSLPRGGPWQYVETDWAALDATDEEFGGDYLVSKWVAEQLAMERDKPFFLACGLYRPHEPWFVPKKYFEPFPLDSIQLPTGYKADDLDDLPPAGKRRGPNRYFPHIRKHDQWKQGIQGYLASIHFADTMLGRVLDALDESPHADNTIVVLWSDHGWHLGEKEHWQKFTGWRVCTRVPLMIRVPEAIAGLPAGTKPSTCDRPVNLLSLFPTLLELSGLPAEEHHDGPSLVPLLKNPQAEWPHASLTYLNSPRNYSVSGERWRMIHYANGDEELYDLDSDPHEWTNLAGEAKHVNKLNELRAFAPKEFAPIVEPE